MFIGRSCLDLSLVLSSTGQDRKIGSKANMDLNLNSSKFCSFLTNTFRLPCEQRLHFRGMSWRGKSSYFSHASSYRENVASARRVHFDVTTINVLHCAENMQ